MIWLALLYLVIGGAFAGIVCKLISKDSPTAKALNVKEISFMVFVSAAITWPVFITIVLILIVERILYSLWKLLLLIFSSPITYMIICTILIFYSCSKSEPAEAGIITGEKHLGGFSYLMECANNKEAPNEPYSIMMQNLIAKHRYIYELNDEEKEILYRIVEAEATDGTIEQKENVASCVLARVESDDFPDTVAKVVFEKYKDTWQFSPLGDGRYYTVKIQDNTIEAVNNVLRNGKTHDCLWFCSDKSYKKKNSYHRLHHEWSFFDEIHHYFY